MDDIACWHSRAMKARREHIIADFEYDDELQRELDPKSRK